MRASNNEAFSGAPGSGNATLQDDNIGSYGAECPTFTMDLRQVDWPNKFWPDLPEKYDGTIDPEELL